jgi:hypothetical protein
MTTAESLAALLLLPIFLACLWRARLLALAILPPLGLAFVQWLDLVDLSSASHPLRWIVPVLCAGLAGLAGWYYAATYSPSLRALRRFDHRRFRGKVASLLVLGSCAPDLLALHPFFWARFAEWPLVPLQIAVEATILAVLLAPERWVLRWTLT